MEVIDTHFHVWALAKFAYPWPTPDMKIYKDYYPCGLEEAVEGTHVKHAVFVQCLNGSVEEAEWVIDMSTRHPIIKGVVAGLDITSSKLEDDIERLKPSGMLKGVRHILDFEKEDWITRDDVSRGLDILANHDISYDLLVRPHHLKYVAEVVSKHPKTRFIINHIAKPPVASGRLDGWKEDMTNIARFDNVFCKISGLISEQTPETWKSIDFQPYIDHVLNMFGADRCVYGSDWPVFQVADASYHDNLQLVQKLLSKLPEEDQRKIFRTNAITFYKLDI